MEPAYLHILKVNLRESPPVDVGASNKNMLPVNNPKLAVEDPPGQAAKVHPPHMNPFRQETQKSHFSKSTQSMCGVNKQSSLKQNHQVLNFNFIIEFLSNERLGVGD